MLHIRGIEGVLIMNASHTHIDGQRREVRTIVAIKISALVLFFEKETRHQFFLKFSANFPHFLSNIYTQN